MRIVCPNCKKEFESSDMLTVCPHCNTPITNQQGLWRVFA